MIQQLIRIHFREVSNDSSDARLASQVCSPIDRVQCFGAFTALCKLKQVQFIITFPCRIKGDGAVNLLGLSNDLRGNGTFKGIMRDERQCA